MVSFIDLVGSALESFTEKFEFKSLLKFTEVREKKIDTILQ